MNQPDPDAVRGTQTTPCFAGVRRAAASSRRNAARAFATLAQTTGPNLAFIVATPLHSLKVACEPRSAKKDMETEMTELSQPMPLEVTAPPRVVDSPAAQTVLHSPPFHQLLSVKRRTVVPLLGASLAFTFGVALLSGFAPALMSMKISGSFTLGYLLIFAIYLVCWTVSVAYVSIANRTFDARVKSVAKYIHGDRP